jgi:hypothetical protein
MNTLPCGNKRCPLCPPQHLDAIPDYAVIKLPPQRVKAAKMVMRNRGMIANIIPLDVDEASSSWAIGSQDDRN